MGAKQRESGIVNRESKGPKAYPDLRRRAYGAERPPAGGFLFAALRMTGF